MKESQNIEEMISQSDGTDLTGAAYRAFWGLELAGTLWDQAREMDDIPLDSIDGAFYWYICRNEEYDLLEASEHDDREEGDTDADRRFARFAMEAADASDTLYGGSYPGLRAPLHQYWPQEMSIVTPWFSSGIVQMLPGMLCLGITNPETRGDEVAAIASNEIERMHALHKATMVVEDFKARSQSMMTLDFRFAEANTLDLSSVYEASVSESLSDEPFVFRSPAVVCRFSYPLPPPEIIARAYDQVVIENNQWHKRLHGFGARRNQTAPVAIRTWAIGLLIGAGIPQQRAKDMVYDHLEIAGTLADPQWSVDRKTLVDRVPEARPFIYKPKLTN